MTVTAFTEMYELVRPTVEHISQPVVARHAARAANEFFRQSHAWRIQDTAYLSDGYAGGVWPLAMAEGDKIRVAKIFSVTTEQEKVLPFASPYQLDRHDPDWRTRSGPPEQIIDQGSRFTVAPVPSSATTLTAEMAIYPRISAVEIPDELFEEHEERLLDGTLARIYAEPNRPWTSLEMAGYHQQLFRQHIEAAARAGAHNQQYRGGMQYGGI